MTNSSSMQYQRIITGYHGCDRNVAQKVLTHEEHLQASENEFDWLGKGVYFWEYGPRRALQFAEEQQARDKVDEPWVLGAYINLGRCFDLADVQHTKQLAEMYEEFASIFEDTPASMPENKSAGKNDHDLLLRYRDCALINWLMSRLDRKVDHRYDYQTVRGVFQ